MTKPLFNYAGQERLIAICAFRYALGRRTLVTGMLVDFICLNRKVFNDYDRNQMIEDITRDIRLGLAGDACDVAEWERARAALIEGGKDEQ